MHVRVTVGRVYKRDVISSWHLCTTGISAKMRHTAPLFVLLLAIGYSAAIEQPESEQEAAPAIVTPVTKDSVALLAPSSTDVDAADQPRDKRSVLLGGLALKKAAVVGGLG